MNRQKNSTTIDTIARDCIAVRLRLLNRVITNLYDDALRPLGAKVSQFNILVVAAKLGLARPAEVCEILQLDTSTLSRNVERMRFRVGWRSFPAKTPELSHSASPPREGDCWSVQFQPGNRLRKKRVNC